MTISYLFSSPKTLTLFSFLKSSCPLSYIVDFSRRLRRWKVEICTELTVAFDGQLRHSNKWESNVTRRHNDFSLSIVDDWLVKHFRLRLKIWNVSLTHYRIRNIIIVCSCAFVSLFVYIILQRMETRWVTCHVFLDKYLIPLFKRIIICQLIVSNYLPQFWR